MFMEYALLLTAQKSFYSSITVE